MKIYRYGKDREYQPCVELDDGTLLTQLEFEVQLFKALEAKGTVTQANIKAQSVV